MDLESIIVFVVVTFKRDTIELTCCTVKLLSCEMQQAN